MRITRRRFIHHGAAGFGIAATLSRHPLSAYAAAKNVRFKIGVTDWNLRQEGKPEALALAKKIGFEGVQVSLGRGTDKLPLSDPATQQSFIAESKRVGLPIASVCLDILHRNILKSDPLGQRWVADSIPVARALGVKVVLLPFFGKGALKTRSEMDRVADILREIAPQAEKANVVLGLEDTISARDNFSIMERAKSPAVLTYYDVGNSAKEGFDIIEEIRLLGRDRICEVHLKDNPHFLGKGKINFPAVIDALADIGFDAWAHLETDCPTDSVENDMTINLGYIRGLVAKRNT